MGNNSSYYLLLARRWIWLLALCPVICGSAMYLISSFLSPVYEASAYLIITVGTPAHPNITESLQAVPTFARLVSLPAVLDPVAGSHAGMSTPDLLARMTVKPQTNTQLIELDVQADTPQLATELANQVSQSFVNYANQGSPDTVTFIPAHTPTMPVRPHPLQDAGLGSAVGLVLALIIVMLFELTSNRASSLEQIQELLGMEILALVPRFSRKTRQPREQFAHAENYAMIGASLDTAQASQPLKLAMFISALAGEGTSTIASAVATHLAQAGKRVLLVDLNIHRPVLRHHFHLKGQEGLTDLLAKQSKRSPERWLPVENYSQATRFAGLRVLTSGTLQMGFSELVRALTATQFFPHLTQAPFDYVLFDTPPLLVVAEAQILASSSEALVLVVDGSRTPRRVLAKTRQLLQRTTMGRVLGVVINQSFWHDQAEHQRYMLPRFRQKREQQRTVEEVTVELPTARVKLISAPEMEKEEQHLPITGETEPIGREASKRVIRPAISLSGLPMSGNGLTRRAFNTDITTPVPPSL